MKQIHSTTNGASFSTCGSAVLHVSYEGESEELAPLFSGTSWGNIVWEASTVLCDHLESLGHEYVKGKTVVELGAGFGLPSLVAALLGADRVLMTDREPELEATRKSLALNMDALASYIPSVSVSGNNEESISVINTDIVDEHDTSTQTSTDKTHLAISAVPLLWGHETTDEFLAQRFAKQLVGGGSGSADRVGVETSASVRHPDIILASDCVSVDCYGAEAIEAFVATVAALAGENTTLLMCTKKRKDGLDDLATKLKLLFESVIVHPLREGQEIGGEIQIVSFTSKHREVA